MGERETETDKSSKNSAIKRLNSKKIGLLADVTVAAARATTGSRCSS